MLCPKRASGRSVLSRSRSATRSAMAPMLVRNGSWRRSCRPLRPEGTGKSRRAGYAACERAALVGKRGVRRSRIVRVSWNGADQAGWQVLDVAGVDRPGLTAARRWAEAKLGTLRESALID